MPTSDLVISLSDTTCLLLVLTLFLYSLYIFYRQWQQKYQMPGGAFYYEEKTEEREILSPDQEAQKLIKQTLWAKKICPANNFYNQVRILSKPQLIHNLPLLWFDINITVHY